MYNNNTWAYTGSLKGLLRGAREQITKVRPKEKKYKESAREQIAEVENIKKVRKQICLFVVIKYREQMQK